MKIRASDMLTITSFGSSSKGNAYLINDGERSLLLEAGINLKGVDLSECDGCLITHEHGDHAKYAMHVINKSGMDVYLSGGTQEALQLPKHRTKQLKALEETEIGNWRVLPFKTEHDVNEPLGFFIQSKDGDCLLFATDTYYIRYKFPGITHLMIECNYSLEILDANVQSGRVGKFLKNRIVKSHFELENVKQFILSNDLSNLKEVWLLHLSEKNANADLFKREIQAITGVPVYIA